jgi:hypothetical protein
MPSSKRQTTKGQLHPFVDLDRLKGNSDVNTATEQLIVDMGNYLYSVTGQDDLRDGYAKVTRISDGELIGYVHYDPETRGYDALTVQGYEPEIGAVEIDGRAEFVSAGQAVQWLEENKDDVVVEEDGLYWRISEVPFATSDAANAAAESAPTDAENEQAVANMDATGSDYDYEDEEGVIHWSGM